MPEVLARVGDVSVSLGDVTSEQSDETVVGTLQRRKRDILTTTMRQVASESCAVVGPGVPANLAVQAESIALVLIALIANTASESNFLAATWGR